MPFYCYSLANTLIRERPMKRIVLPRQRQLFEAPSHKNVVVLPTVNRTEVVQLLSKLLGEIALADHSTGAEADDDQDQR